MLSVCIFICRYIHKWPQKIQTIKNYKYCLLFLLEQKFVDDNIKADVKLIYFLGTNGLLFVL